MAGNPDTIILLTRPKAQSTHYQADLARLFAGQATVIVSPLIIIKTIAAEVDVSGADQLLFSSTNGVEAFAALSHERGVAALCVGEKTTIAARAHGLDVEFTGSTTAELTRYILASDTAKQHRFLYLRGQHVARPIVDTLIENGCDARQVEVYQQDELPLTDAAKSVLAGGNRVILPLFSPRTARIFQASALDLDLGRTTAICISQTASAPLDITAFANVLVADAPNSKSITRKITTLL